MMQKIGSGKEKEWRSCIAHRRGKSFAGRLSSYETSYSHQDVRLGKALANGRND